MSEIIVSQETALVEPSNAEEATLMAASAKAALAIAKRTKNLQAIKRAELVILECQRIIAEEYVRLFPKGRPNKSASSGRLNPDDWCKAHDTSQRTVRRWEELIEPDKFEKRKEAIHAKVEKAFDMDQPANYSSESEEWYTPPQYLEAVHALFIPDLDPASNDFANETVKAGIYWTLQDHEEQHTLERDWFGRVFCNPPYGKDPVHGSLAGAFCNKAIAEYEAGRVTECVLLINSLHSQKWQAPLFQFPICLVDHRIKFVSGDGTPNQNPTMQNMFVYLGDRPQAFRDAFSRFGYVVRSL